MSRLYRKQGAEIESSIYWGAAPPEILMRENLNEHPACYLCLCQAVSRFTLCKYYITTGIIHSVCSKSELATHP